MRKNVFSYVSSAKEMTRLWKYFLCGIYACLISISDNNRWSLPTMHQRPQSIQVPIEVIFPFGFQAGKHNRENQFSACNPNDLHRCNLYMLVLYVQSIIKTRRNTCNKSMLAGWAQSISFIVFVSGQHLWISIYEWSESFFSTCCICNLPTDSTTLNLCLALYTVLNVLTLKLFLWSNVFKMSLAEQESSTNLQPISLLLLKVYRQRNILPNFRPDNGYEYLTQP